MTAEQITTVEVIEAWPLYLYAVRHFKHAGHNNTAVEPDTANCFSVGDSLRCAQDERMQKARRYAGRLVTAHPDLRQPIAEHCKLFDRWLRSDTIAFNEVEASRSVLRALLVAVEQEHADVDAFPWRCTEREITMSFPKRVWDCLPELHVSYYYDRL